MSNLVEIKKRIASIASTIKVTKVMQMIATAKIAKIKQTIVVANRYEAASKSILAAYLKNTAERNKINFFIKKDNEKNNIKNILLILMSSDKGTCGSINTNIFKEFSLNVKKYNENNCKINVFPIGKKAKKYLELNSKKLNINEVFEDININAENKNTETINHIINLIIEKYKNGVYDAIYLIYNKFINIITYKPVCELILPIEYNNDDKKEDFVNIYETESMCKSVIELFIRSKFYSAYISNIASITSSRMNSMDNATKNGKEIIDDLRIKYNKSRQANITSELSDIVSGAEAIS